MTKLEWIETILDSNEAATNEDMKIDNYSGNMDGNHASTAGNLT